MKKYSFKISGEFNAINVLVEDDNKNIRFCINPNDIVVGLPIEILEAISEYHTPEIKVDYKAYIEQNDHKYAVDSQTVTNQKNYGYLSATDWYVTRYVETGIEIPDDIKLARKAARLAIIHD